MSRLSLIFIGVAAHGFLYAAPGGADGSPKKPKIDKAAAHANAPGESDDTLDITLDDGTVITDTPMRIIERVQAGEFALPAEVAETVADAHNAAVLDPAKDTGEAALVVPEDLTKASEGNVVAPLSDGVPGSTSPTGTGSGSETLRPDAPAVPPAETTEGVNANANPDQQELPPEQKVLAEQQPKDPAIQAAKRPDVDEPEQQTPGPAEGQPAIVGTDTGLAAAAPQITEAPGPSTQADSSTTVAGTSVITDENPVVQAGTGATSSAPTPADVTAIAPAPDGNSSTMAANTKQDATAADFAASPTPPQNTINPRAQDGSDVELTGAKAGADAAKVEPGTWTPAAALAPQMPTTLEEHAQQEAMKAAAEAPGAGSIEDRLAALEKRVKEVEEHGNELDADLTVVEDRLSKLEPGVS